MKRVRERRGYVDFVCEACGHKVYVPIFKLNDDIKVWENNIGFFANSKKSESMIKNINDQIDSAKNNVDLLKNNINELEKIVS